MATRSGRQLSLSLADREAGSPAPASTGSTRRAPRRNSSRTATLRKEAGGERARLIERASRLADRLSLLLSERVRLTVTDNTSTMVSFRRSAGLVSFRVHQMFLDAPSEVVQALADYASRGRRAAGSVIDDFVRANEDRIRRSRVERQMRSLDPLGRFHDLQAYFDDLNRTCFGGRIAARIGWGREAPARRRRSIKMGTYYHDAKIIRIHPALDRPEVPAWFVRFVIFHEMLHQAMPPRTIGGRRVAHTPEFRIAEQAYPDYDRAIAWEREHLSLLLGARSRRMPHFDPDDPLA